MIETDLRTIALTVNGHRHSVVVESRTSLADVLREQLRLTGTHLGCEHGVCGACTVIVDGEAVRACLLLAVQASGTEVETVENLAPDQQHLNALQQQFVEHHGLQCGYCTPGILMTLTAELRHHPQPNEQEVREMLAGNLCRCTGYLGMIDAVLAWVAATNADTAR